MNKKIKLLIFSLIISAITLTTISADTTSDLLPVSNGTYSAWSPSSGSSTSKYSLVDEATCNGTTDYVYTTTLYNKESYNVNISSIPNGATITSITFKPCASRHLTGTGNTAFDVFYILDGEEYGTTDGQYYITGTTPTEQTPYEFYGSPVTKTGSSTLEIGATLSIGTRGVRLSRLAATVTYEPLYAPTSLIVNSSGTTKNLSWTDNSEYEDGFLVERSKNNTSSFSQVGSTSENVTTFFDGNNATGTIYYRVRAYNSGGYSSYSNTASVTIP